MDVEQTGGWQPVSPVPQAMDQLLPCPEFQLHKLRCLIKLMMLICSVTGQFSFCSLRDAAR